MKFKFIWAPRNICWLFQPIDKWNSKEGLIFGDWFKEWPSPVLNQLPQLRACIQHFIDHEV